MTGTFGVILSNYIITNLGKVDVHRIKQDEILDVFDAIKLYDNSILENSFV